MIPRTHCPVCASSEHRRWFSRERFEVRQCRCGLRFVATLLDDDELRRYYTERAEIRFRDWRESSDPKLMNRLSEIAALLPPPARLLDVGCGLGDFVVRATRAGYDAMGLEIAADIAARAREVNGVRVVSEGLDALPAESFDVVTLLDVIEHVYDPARVVAACARILRPGGLLVIDTPNGASGYDFLLTVLRTAPMVSGRFSYSHVQIFRPEHLVRLLDPHFHVTRHDRLHELSLPMEEVAARTRVPLPLLRSLDRLGWLPRNKQVVHALRR